MKINAKHLILDLLLANQNTPLSAKDAIAACALFGISDNSVRVALARASADGLLCAAGRGTYCLGDSALELAGDVATWRTKEQRLRSWQGNYLVVLSHSLGRSNRSALRHRERALAMLGFKELETGLHIRPDNIEDNILMVRKRLYSLGLEKQALVFVAQQFSPEQEQAIYRLWDGAALNQRYEQLQQQLTQWLAHAHDLEADVAARESFLLGRKAIREVVFDPLLPAPWVDVAARHAFVDTVHRFDREGHRIWRQLITHSLP